MTRDQIRSLDLTTEGNTVVIFLPHISKLLKDEEFIGELISTFGIDRFYLTQTAYDSNGFFRGSKAEQSVGCRFLVKELNEIDNDSQFDEVRQELYDLIPQPLKEKLEKQRSITESDIASFPDDTNHTLLHSFVHEFWEDILRAISDKLMSQDPGQNQIQESRHFKGHRHPSLELKRLGDNRQTTFETKAEFLASYSLPPSNELVDRCYQEGSEHRRHFIRMLGDLAESQDPPTACDVLRRWMKKDKAQLVLSSVIEICMEKDFKFLKLIDEMLVRIYHRSNCLLEDRPEPAEPAEPTTQDEPTANDQATKVKAKAKPKLLKTKVHSKAIEALKCREIKLIYHWFFFFFWIRTFTQPSDKSSTQVMLCFDDCDSPKIKQIIRKILSKDKTSWDTPEKLLYCITEQVVSIFDAALWGFRVPVRAIEKVSFAQTWLRHNALTK